MKTYKKQTVSQLVASFDNELKDLLMGDLKLIRSIKTKMTLIQGGLTAA